MDGEKKLEQATNLRLSELIIVCVSTPRFRSSLFRRSTCFFIATIGQGENVPWQIN